MARLDHLPTEIVCLIIQNLFENYPGDRKVYKKQLLRCALVNKQFNTAVNPILWHSALIVSDAHTRQFLTSLKVSRHSSGRLVRYLYLLNPRYNRILLRLVQHLGNLAALHIPNARRITDKSIKQLATYCPHLTSLQLVEASITNTSIQTLAQHCPHLHTLSVVACPRLTCNMLSLLIDYPSLTQLEIGTHPDTKENWMTSTATTAMTDMTRLHHLTTLSITGTPLPFTRFLLSAIHPDTGKAPCWPHLVEFTTDDQDGGIDDDLLIAFLQSHPDLTRFCFGTGLATDALLDAIPTLLPKVKYLGFKDNTVITARSLRRLIQRCPLLIDVDIEDCDFYVRQFPEARGTDPHYGGWVDYLNQHVVDTIRRSNLGDEDDGFDFTEEGHDDDDRWGSPSTNAPTGGAA
ncbi:unnamed protein product [Absidia cylindrospora]